MILSKREKFKMKTIELFKQAILEGKCKIDIKPATKRKSARIMFTWVNKAQFVSDITNIPEAEWYIQSDGTKRMPICSCLIGSPGALEDISDDYETMLDLVRFAHSYYNINQLVMI